MSNFSRGWGSLLSKIVGHIARITSPRMLVTTAQRLFIKHYNLNMDECVIPPQGFLSLHELFIRDLKSDVRPYAQEPIIPVDGYLRDMQDSSGELLQVKGISYSVAELTNGKAQDGVVANMYLSPKDYHQVHSPVSGVLKEITFVAGPLWPVNDWALKNVVKLFSRNERAIFTIETGRYGTVMLVMVGALNVGNILTPWGDAPVHGEADICSITPNVSIKAGDKLGAFALGSSVLVVFPRRDFMVESPSVGPLRLGEAFVDKGLKRRGASA